MDKNVEYEPDSPFVHDERSLKNRAVTATDDSKTKCIYGIN
jgi:hypothetical protein